VPFFFYGVFKKQLFKEGDELVLLTLTGSQQASQPDTQPDTHLTTLNKFF
jgi:hypothetical protein